MAPAGQNYPIAEHSFLFWGLFLGSIILMTIAILALFAWRVQRASQATRDGVAATPASRPASLPAADRRAPVHKPAA